jgi:hypothetical protein
VIELARSQQGWSTAGHDTDERQRGSGVTELARSQQGWSTAGHDTDERQRGSGVTELARSPMGTAALLTASTSASEEVL